VPARIHICLTFFSGIILFLLVSMCSAETLLSNGQLTVQVDGVPLTVILEDISRQGNISIQTQGSLTGQMVTAHFGPLPLEVGLKRLLRKNNYLATFDKNENIIKLIISRKASVPLSGGYNTPPQVEQEIPVPPEPPEIVPQQEQPDPQQEQPDPELPEVSNE
jgi:hypothetical protein